MARKTKLPPFRKQNDYLDAYRARLYYNIPFPKRKVKENGVVVRLEESIKEERFQVMRQINSKLLAGYSQSDIVRWLEIENFYSGKHQGYAIIRETKLVFGDVADSDKKGNTYVMIGNFQRLAQSFRRLGDLVNESMMLKEIAKLQGLYENTEETDFSQFAMPRQLVFTTQQVVQKSIDIDYEEVEEN
jgi:hypothetical protein